MNNYLIIYTGLYSKKAYDILTRAQHNILNIENLHYTAVINFSLLDIKMEPNGEVVLKINKETTNSKTKTIYGGYMPCCFNESIYINKSPQEILDFIANSIINTLHYNIETSNSVYDIKTNAIIQEYNGTYINLNGNETNNKCKEIITKQDIFCLCDLLYKKPNIKDLYTKDQIDNIIGIAFNPVQTEQNAIAVEEYNKLNDKYNKKLIYHQARLDIELNKINEEHEKRIKNIIETYKQIENNIKLDRKNKTAKMFIDLGYTL